MRQTEICRSHIMTTATARIFSSVIAVVGRALRGVSAKAHVGFMNSATHFATVRHDGADHRKHRPTV